MIVKKREPNHICRNPKCDKGINGKPKEYWACDYCDRKNTWRALCCSIECFNELMDTKPANPIYPNRTDKTENETRELFNKSVEQVRTETIEELSDYSEIISEQGLTGAINEINKEIDRKTSDKKCKF